MIGPGDEDGGGRRVGSDHPRLQPPLLRLHVRSAVRDETGPESATVSFNAIEKALEGFSEYFKTFAKFR